MRDTAAQQSLRSLKKEVKCEKSFTGRRRFNEVLRMLCGTVGAFQFVLVSVAASLPVEKHLYFAQCDEARTFDKNYGYRGCGWRVILYMECHHSITGVCTPGLRSAARSGV